MADGIDEAASAFATEVAPEATKPRDTAGRFVQTTERPEPMFSERAIEGDPETGDTQDGGDDGRLRARERRVADGHDQRQGRRSASNAQELRRTPGGDEEHESAEDEQDDNGELQPVDESGEVEGTADDAEKYEVTVDGNVYHVTFGEMQRGYIREATFHQRLAQINQAQTELNGEIQRLQANWAILAKARQDYEDDLANLLPKEPNWDQEFARDPQGAHQTQKIFQALYDKLAQSRNYRAQVEAWQAAETDRRTQKYALDGFRKFVADCDLFDDKTREKEIRSMRRTALAEGFSEYEIATVFDPRMLKVLRKASKYDRMTANRPKAVIPGQGKTLTPGAATPLGNVRRKGFDDAQRRLASSGKLEDAVDVFRRIL